MKRQLQRRTRPRVMLPRNLTVTKVKPSAKNYKRKINFDYSFLDYRVDVN